MIKKLILYVFIVFYFVQNGFGQNEIKKAGTLYNENRFKIDLYIQKSTKPCGVQAIKNKYRLAILNLKTFYSDEKKVINWKMDIVNCNDEIIQKTISVDLEEILADESKLDDAREFEGSEIVRAFYDVYFTDMFFKTEDIVKGRTKSEAAQSISGKKEINSKEMTVLTVNGGSLINGAEWIWYKDECGLNEVGRGQSITLNPQKTTTYFVRAQDAKNNHTACISETVVVDDNSKPALRIIGNNFICRGAIIPISLKVEGGKLGINANWVWYENVCPDLKNAAKKIGVGDEIKINPDKTITYYVRAEGVTNTTTCIEFTVEVIENTISPKHIKASKDKVCENGMVTLQAEGGVLSPNASWVWFESKSGSSIKNKIGNGNSIVVYPSENTEYFVEPESKCISGNEISVKIEIIKKSTIPSYIAAYPAKAKRNSYKLTVIGGNLANNANWIWYLNNCDGKKIGTGGELIYKLGNKAHDVFVRAEGECNVTNCVSTKIPALKRKDFKYFFINTGVVTHEFSVPTNFSVTVGSKLIYLRVKFPLDFTNDNKPGEDGYECYDKTLVSYPANSSAYYKFNDKVYIKASSYTLGLMFGGRTLRVYLGGGYGVRDVYWGVNIYSNSNNNLENSVWAKNLAQSISGPEIEAGLFLKLGHFNIMGGANMVYSPSTKNNYISSDIGIGFSF